MTNAELVEAMRLASARARLKHVIVSTAIRGLIPARAAQWLIGRLALKHE